MALLTYRRFYEQSHAEEVVKILTENSVKAIVEIEKSNLDSLYGDKHFDDLVCVKIEGDDFSRADVILKQLSQDISDNVEQDHYLFKFTDEELFEVVTKADEWNELDVQLAKKLLTERGKGLSDEAIELLRKQRIKDLAKPEDREGKMVYAGYIFAFISGLIGAFIGWILISSKKTLPNGQQVYSYSEKDRRHGRWILIIGTIMFATYMAIRYVRI